MLVSSALAFFAVCALFGHAARAASPQNRQSKIKCSVLFNYTWSLSQHNFLTNSYLSVGFTNARDPQGRLQLSTSVDGVATSNSSTFVFANCSSTTKISLNGAQVAQGVVRYNGQLRPANDLTRCATIMPDATEYQPIVSTECLTVDNTDLSAQWWAFDVQPGDEFGDLNLVGSVDPSYFGYSFNNAASGNARLVEAGLITNRSSVYSLELRLASKSAPADQLSSASMVRPLSSNLFLMTHGFLMFSGLLLLYE